MHSIWKTSVLYTIVLTVALGLGYPLLMTVLAGLLFPHRAAGSLVTRNGRVVGSELIAQGFTADRYFHPRPSAAGNGYDATASGGSNLAQSSKALVDRMQGSIDALEKENPSQPVPMELVTTSASGLDPEISREAALFQAPRVAKARKLDEARVRSLIESHLSGRQLGLLGEPRINVLALNLALDEAAQP